MIRISAILFVSLVACSNPPPDGDLGGGGSSDEGGGTPEGGSGGTPDLGGNGGNPPTQECEISADCPWSQFCDGGICVARGDEGAPCDEDRECIGGSLCEEPCPVLFCDPNTHKCSGLDALQNCETWHECGADQYCNGSCHLDRSEGQFCLHVSWCQIGLACDPELSVCVK